MLGLRSCLVGFDRGLSAPEVVEVQVQGSGGMILKIQNGRGGKGLFWESVCYYPDILSSIYTLADKN